MCIEPAQRRLLAVLNGCDATDETPLVARDLGTPPSQLARYEWTGREREAEIDLQYNRARHFDPSVGRWLSDDGLTYDASDEHKYPYAS